MKNAGSTLVLARLPPIRSLLLITELQAVFACCETVDAAAAAVRAITHGLPIPLRS